MKRNADRQKAGSAKRWEDSHRLRIADHKRGPAELESILCTPELWKRPSRSPDFEAESRAILEIVQTLHGSSRRIFQRLAETAVVLGNAGSAGVSVLEDDRFRWRSLAGASVDRLQGSYAREFSPFGLTLDCNSTQLFCDPHRHFADLSDFTPRITELLCTPIHAEAIPIGAMALMSHDKRRQFDAEDARILENLSRFASAIYRLFFGRKRPVDVDRRLHILVVDDVEDAAESLAMLLRMDGHEVRTAYDGPSAVRTAAEWCPEAVVQDIAMPGMTGYEVAQSLRQWSGTKDALLIAVSGSEVRSRSLDAGFDHHLMKPVDIEKLRGLLSPLSQQSRNPIRNKSAA